MTFMRNFFLRNDFEKLPFTPISFKGIILTKITKNKSRNS